MDSSKLKIIAHDLNNSLSVILGYSEEDLRKLEPDNPLREDFEEILIAAKKAIVLVRELSELSNEKA